jgi:nicotinamide-nucleotide amidase
MLLDDTHVALAAELGRSLSARGWRVAVAESCTGGLVAGAITAIAGSSEWFDRGFVTYSNEAKHEMLDVPTTLIDEFGAVSEPVAAAMARGARSRSRAQCALAVTGVAGPGGGTAAKPVGMVCFGWVADGLPERVATVNFGGDRAAVRARSVTEALDGLLDMLAAAAASTPRTTPAGQHASTRSK